MIHPPVPLHKEGSATPGSLASRDTPLISARLKKRFCAVVARRKGRRESQSASKPLQYASKAPRPIVFPRFCGEDVWRSTTALNRIFLPSLLGKKFLSVLLKFPRILQKERGKLSLRYYLFGVNVLRYWEIKISLTRESLLYYCWLLIGVKHYCINLHKNPGYAKVQKYFLGEVFGERSYARGER